MWCLISPCMKIPFFTRLIMRQLAGRFRNGSWPIFCHNYFFFTLVTFLSFDQTLEQVAEIFLWVTNARMCMCCAKVIHFKKCLFTFVQRLTPCVSSEELNSPERVSRNWYLAILFCKSISFIFSSCSRETYFDCVTVRNSFYQTRYCAELWSEHKILWLNLRTQSFELSSLSIDLCFVVSGR